LKRVIHANREMMPRINRPRPANLLEGSFAKPAPAAATVENEVAAKKAKTAQGSPKGNPLE
jgi:hypothetical protein